MTFIIAEIGSNFNSLEQAKDAVSFAAACGASAVKFQLFDSQSLYGFPHIDIEAVYSDDETYTSLPVDWLPKLKEKADACGIEFMCSAFSPELYDAVDPYVLRHKIASSEVTCPQILEKVASFGKPIIMSVGASSKGDIARALDFMASKDVTLLYCSSSYPARNSNLFMMEDLARTFKLPVGLSDHSTEVIYTSLSAVRHFKAPVVEKHVDFFNSGSPDSPHSLNHEEFARYCAAIRYKGEFEYQSLGEERDMFMRHNRRLLACNDIAAGEILRFGVNYGAFRSLVDDVSGLSGFDWELVDGKPAAVAVEAGQAISPRVVGL